MAERDHDPDRQLDLLRGFGAPDEEPARRPEPLAVRWAEVDAPGKLGRAACPGSGISVREDLEHLRDHHRATIVLAVAQDVAALLEAARELGIDVRHLEKGASSDRLTQQASALAADLRAGRRAVVVSADASAAALPLCCALVVLGQRIEDAQRAVGESALAPKEREALAAFALERSRPVGGNADASAVSAPPKERESAATQEAARPVGGNADASAVSAAPKEREAAAAQGSADASAVDESAPPKEREGLMAAAAQGGSADAASAVREAEADYLAADEGDEEEEGEEPAGSAPPELDDDPFGHDDSDEDDEDEGRDWSGEDDPSWPDEAPAQRIESASPIATPIAPELDAIARSPRRSRLAGAVLGGAIGDAMGHPTEFIRSFDAIRERYGPDGVTGYELWRERDGTRFAPYTDDTQMAEQVLRSLLWARDRDADLDATMRDMAERFVSWAKDPQGGHRAPGNACLAGCRNLERGVPWHEAGGATAGGCGSVMRAYPFGLVFANDLDRCERWAVAHSKLTHRDPIALAASAAMAVGVARVMRDEPLELVLSEMVAAACRYSPKTAAMMARAIDEAESGIGPETTLERLEGWAAHEAIAAAVYLFARHPDDPRAAILEGANTPGDSDSLATLAGALVGARVGIAAFPPDWVRDVERSEALLALAAAI